MLTSADIQYFIYFPSSVLVVIKCLFSHKNVYFEVICADIVYPSEESYPYLLIIAGKQFLYKMHHTIFCSHTMFYLFFFIHTGGTKIFILR